MLIKYKDVVYKVKTVIDPYEEHTKLELMCHIYKRGK
nr:MAG TPA: head-tail joining protein [Caudoviricetes sp.]